MEINYAHSEVKLFTEKSMATDNMACKIVIFSPIIYKPQWKILWLDSQILKLLAFLIDMLGNYLHNPKVFPIKAVVLMLKKIVSWTFDIFKPQYFFKNLLWLVLFVGLGMIAEYLFEKMFLIPYIQMIM